MKIRIERSQIMSFSTQPESYEKDFAKRQKQVCEMLAEYPDGLTAKEVSVGMYYKGYIPTTERNFSAPRLNELIHNGKVKIIGKRICDYSGKKVSVFTLITR